MAKREKKKASVRSALSPKEVLGLVDDPRARTLLRALGLLTPRGGASADAHRKIKQITHLARLIAPAIEDAYDRHQEPVVVDAAAGKGYIGLLLYERLMRPRGRGRMVLVEAREDLVQRLRRWVRELGYERVEVIHAPVVEAPLPERVHVVVALHACDTATDEVIVRALRARADHVALVPCCQAEVARLLERTPKGPTAPLWSDAWHRREFGAHYTNVLRTLVLRARGYRVRATELTGWEHSVKNELILARRVGRYHRGAEAQLGALLEEIPVRPWLLEALPDDEEPAEARSDGSEGDAPEQAQPGSSKVSESASSGGSSPTDA